MSNNIAIGQPQNVTRLDSPEKIVDFFANFGTQIGFRIVWSILFLIIGLLIVKLLIWISRKVLQRKKFNDTAVYFIISMINVMLKLFVIMIAIDLLGIEMISMATILAAMAFAVGLALSGLLQNFVAGAYLVVAQPINVGDYVQVVGDIEGSVQTVGVVNTVVQTPDRRQVIIPNSNLATNNIINYDKEPIRRCDRKVTIPLDEDIPYVKEILLRACRHHPMVLADPPPQVRVMDLTTSDARVVLSVRAFITKENYWDFWFAMPELIKHTFEKYNISIEIPQQSVYIHDPPVRQKKRPITPEPDPPSPSTTKEEHKTSAKPSKLQSGFFSRRMRTPLPKEQLKDQEPQLKEQQLQEQLQEQEQQPKEEQLQPKEKQLQPKEQTEQAPLEEEKPVIKPIVDGTTSSNGEIEDHLPDNNSTSNWRTVFRKNKISHKNMTDETDQELEPLSPHENDNSKPNPENVDDRDLEKGS